MSVELEIMKVVIWEFPFMGDLSFLIDFTSSGRKDRSTFSCTSLNLLLLLSVKLALFSFKQCRALLPSQTEKRVMQSKSLNLKL